MFQICSLWGWAEEKGWSKTEMSHSTSYPKRLIEVDLPIKRISGHARREKSIRHGHISTLQRTLALPWAIPAALWIVDTRFDQADHKKLFQVLSAIQYPLRKP
jgi:hypothetical protein